MMWLLLERAFAHNGAVPIRGSYDWSHLPDLPPGEWIVWEAYPSIVLGCLAWLVWYGWMASRTGQPTRRQALCFLGSIRVVFGSLQGPLHELSDLYLFSCPMVHHLLLTLVFPPLFLLGLTD